MTGVYGCSFAKFYWVGMTCLLKCRYSLKIGFVISSLPNIRWRNNRDLNPCVCHGFVLWPCQRLHEEIVERCFFYKINYFMALKFSSLRFTNPEMIHTCEGRGMFFFQLCPVLQVGWFYFLALMNYGTNFAHSLGKLSQPVMIYFDPFLKMLPLCAWVHSAGQRRVSPCLGCISRS